MKKSARIAFCGICAAISLALMMLGSVLYVFTYAVPMILGIINSAARKTFSYRDAFLIYSAVSVLSFILIADKECALMYALFFGIYSIIEPKLGKINPKPLSFAIKMIFFNAAISLIELLAVYVFRIPFFEGGFSLASVLVFGILMNFCFICYDKILKVYMLLYEKRIEKRIIKIFKG